MCHKGKRCGLGILIPASIFSLLFLLFWQTDGTTVEALAASSREMESSNPGFGPSPRIFTIHPQAGKSGDLVYIYGENFGHVQEDSEVRFYGQPATVTMWRNDMIAVIVPPDLDHLSVPVQVTNISGGSDFVYFNYLAAGEYPPDLSISIAPKSSYQAGRKNVRISVTASFTSLLPQGAKISSKIYLSKGHTPEPEDILLWSEEISPEIYDYNPTDRGFGVRTAIVNIPNVPTGNYFFLAAVDWSNLVKEINEENNFLAIPVRITAPYDSFPVAGITLSGQGKTAYEKQTLGLSGNSRGMAVVYFSAVRSAFSGNMALYRWILDGRPVSFRIGFSSVLKPGNHRVSLEVMDKYRRRSITNASIVIGNGPDWLDNGPYVPLVIRQFEADGITPLEHHWITHENMVVLKAKVVNPNGNPVMLQVELRDMSENFTGEANYQSPFYVASGEEAFIAMPGLAPWSYQWHLRSVDSRGGYSPWVSIHLYETEFYFSPPEIP